MSDQRIIDLSEQEIRDMDLEGLANMFLTDFSKILNEERGNTHNLDNFLKTIIGHHGNFGVRCAVSEAFQWLYNEGYIMHLLTSPSTQTYFITRAGKKRLDEIE